MMSKDMQSDMTPSVEMVNDYARGDDSTWSTKTLESKTLIKSNSSDSKTKIDLYKVSHAENPARLSVRVFLGIKEEDIDLDKEIFTAFVDWYCKKWMDVEYDLPQVLSEGAMTGEYALIAPRIRRIIGDMKGQPTDMRDFLRGSVADTLIAWEEQEATTHEQRVDCVLMPLLRLPKPECSKSLRAFSQAIRGHLLCQERRKAGYWSTVAQLGDLIGSNQGTPCVLAGAIHYHDALVGVMELSATPRSKRADDQAVLCVQKSANNLCGRINDYAGLGGGELPENDIAKVMQDLMVLNAYTGLVDVDKVAYTEVPERIWSMFYPEIEYSAGRAPRVLDEFMNIASAWRRWTAETPESERELQEPDRINLRETWASCATACLRLWARRSREDDGDDAVASFFNAAVDLRRCTFRKAPPTVRYAALLNALGLWWALHYAKDTEVLALVKHNGLDCLVNLAGSLTDLPEVTGKDELCELAGWAIVSLGRSQGSRSDLAKLSRSLKERDLVPSAPMAAPTVLVANIVRLLAESLGLPLGAAMNASTGKSDPLGLVLEPGKFEENAQRTAELIFAGFTAQHTDGELIMSAMKNSNAQMKTPIEAVLRFENLDEALRTCYGRMKNGGPLCAAGLMDQDEWERAVAEVRGHELPSLGEWLQTADLSWIR